MFGEISGPASLHLTDKAEAWSLSLGWRLTEAEGVPGLRPLPLASFSPSSPRPQGPLGKLLLPAAPHRLPGQGRGGAGDRGAAVRSPRIPEPGIHLQTDVSNNSPSTRRAKTAGGLAEAEVKVNCFTAVLPTPAELPRPSPQRPPLLPKSGPQEQENGFHVG